MLLPSQRSVSTYPRESKLIWQYVDVLVAATYSDDGSLGTACSSLAMRLREQNGVVCSFIPSLWLCLFLGCIQGSLDSASDDPIWIYRSATGSPSKVAVSEVAEPRGPELRGSVVMSESMEDELINRIPPSD